MIPVKPIEEVPLKTDDDGVVRVARTRVTLDIVITAFQSGATAEEVDDSAGDGGAVALSLTKRAPF